MSEHTTENDQQPSSLGTCPREGCHGHGRPLWRTHTVCPWCRTAVVAYVSTPPGQEATR